VHNFVIDRFEGDLAIIETLEGHVLTFRLPKTLLPRKAKEGDVLNIDITINRAETRQRKKAIRNKIDSLKKQDKGDDIAL
jgi:hypothetical protein